MQVRPNVHYVRPSPVENGYLSHGSLKLSYRRQSHSKTLTSMPGSARKHFPRLPPKFRPLLMRLRKPLPQETLLQKWRQYAAQGRLGSTSLRQVNTPEMPATRVEGGGGGGVKQPGRRPWGGPTGESGSPTPPANPMRPADIGYGMHVRMSHLVQNKRPPYLVRSNSATAIGKGVIHDRELPTSHYSRLTTLTILAIAREM